MPLNNKTASGEARTTDKKVSEDVNPAKTESTKAKRTESGKTEQPKTTKGAVPGAKKKQAKVADQAEPQSAKAQVSFKLPKLMQSQGAKCKPTIGQVKTRIVAAGEEAISEEETEDQDAYKALKRYLPLANQDIARRKAIFTTCGALLRVSPTIAWNLGCWQKGGGELV